MRTHRIQLYLKTSTATNLTQIHRPSPTWKMQWSPILPVSALLHLRLSANNSQSNFVNMQVTSRRCSAQTPKMAPRLTQRKATVAVPCEPSHGAAHHLCDSPHTFSLLLTVLQTHWSFRGSLNMSGCSCHVREHFFLRSSACQSPSSGMLTGPSLISSCLPSNVTFSMGGLS